MRIVHLSDSHISADKPARTADLERTVVAINALTPLPDVVIHTGDVAHHGQPADYAIARTILDRLAAPCFVIPGNRDDRRHLLAAFADRLPLGCDAAFAQYAIEDFRVRLILADTHDAASNKGRFCEQRLASLAALLSADTSRPAVVCFHHPPFDVAVGPEARHFSDWAEAERIGLELRQHRHVGALLAGHVHRAFTTELGHMQATVVSSVASDIRWDRSDAGDPAAPVFASHDLAG